MQVLIEAETATCATTPAGLAVIAEGRDLRDRIIRAIGGAGARAGHDRSSGPPAVVVVAIATTDAEAASLLRDLDARWGAPIVAVLPDATSRRQLGRAVRAGASGLVLESRMEETLGATISAVTTGQVVVPDLARFALQPPVFSGREREVLRLAVAGLCNDEIGDRLFLATSTVKGHLSAAFAKLGVHSRGEAAELLLDPHEPIGRYIMAEAPGELRPVVPTGLSERAREPRSAEGP